MHPSLGYVDGFKQVDGVFCFYASHAIGNDHIYKFHSWKLDMNGLSSRIYDWKLLKNYCCK